MFSDAIKKKVIRIGNRLHALGMEVSRITFSNGRRLKCLISGHDWKNDPCNSTLDPKVGWRPGRYCTRCPETE